MRGRTLLIAGLLTAAFAGQAAAQITGTQHNLSAQAGIDNDEICVYCHTPHGADTTVEAPLWNKPATGTTYTPLTAPPSMAPSWPSDRFRSPA